MRGRIPEGLLVKCPQCLESVVKKDYEDAFKVCPKCAFHERLTAQQRIAQLLDEGSFVEKDREMIAGDPLRFADSKPYPERLASNREKTGMNEGVACGTGKIQGHRISVAVMDMNFVGGSMGTAVGEKITRTLERGLNEEIPVLLVCASGGARMQEGILSLMQMAKTCAVASRLAQTRIPFLTLLTDPTTGGVTASFALLGDVIIAEPNALLGFAGQRVIESTIKQTMPDGFQRAEFMTQHGFVDLVCKRGDLRSTIGTLLTYFLHARREAVREQDAPAAPAEILQEVSQSS